MEAGKRPSVRILPFPCSAVVAVQSPSTVTRQARRIPLASSSEDRTRIAQILLDEGYIKSYTVADNGNQGVIHITLKYLAKKQPALSGLKRVSKPGLRIYAGAEELPKVLKGLGIAIVSTSKGVMTDKKARELHIGGEVLAFVW